MSAENICTNCQKVTIWTELGMMEIIYSYGTPVLSWSGNSYHRHWSGWSATTSRHISKAIGRSIPKKEWEKMEVEALEIPSQF